MGKIPYFPIYPGDELRGPISGCSLEAQGLWLRMRMIMHDSERYGYLGQHGSAIPPGSIARRCGCTLVQYEALLSELSDAGVIIKTKEGVIYDDALVNFAKERTEARERKRNERLRHQALLEDHSAVAKTLVEACHADVTVDVTDVTVDVTSMSHPYSSSSSLSCTNTNPSTRTPTLSGKPDLLSQIREIFVYWQGAHGKQRCILDKKRSSVVRARLKEGYSVDRIKSAIRGIVNSPHHMGENDNGTVYNDLELICRTGKNVDRFAEMEGNHGTARKGAKTKPTQAELNAAVIASLERGWARAEPGGDAGRSQEPDNLLPERGVDRGEG